MEGMAVATSIDKIITTLGMSGTLILMGVIAFFVIREVKKENNSTRCSFEGFKSSTDAQIRKLADSVPAQLNGFRESIEVRLDKLQEQSDAHDAAIEKRLEQAEKDIKFLEKETVTKEMLFRETEGWRSEIQLMRNEINRIPYEILKLTEGRKHEK